MQRRSTTEAEPVLLQHGLEFSSIGPSTSTTEKNSKPDLPNAPHSHAAELHRRVGLIVADMEMFLRETPAALAKFQIDALIIDEISLAGPTIAQMLNFPYFVVSTSVPHNFGWSVPRRYLGYRYPASSLARSRNAVLEVSVLRMKGPVRDKLNEFRLGHGLRPIQEIDHVFPPLAHIAQLPRCLDLPRSHLPANFHYTGPFVDEAARPLVDFPWHRLDDRPLVYASLGTARSIRRAAFHLIAEACSQLNLQLVISLGGRGSPENFIALPGYPVVVAEAPQLELIKRAALIFTHGGLNTALEALLQGKPMIVLPVAYDQPAVAARLVRLRVAEALQVDGLCAEKIRAALIKLLTTTRYSDAARELQRSIQAVRGLEPACNVIETAMRNASRGHVRNDDCVTRR